MSEENQLELDTYGFIQHARQVLIEIVEHLATDNNFDEMSEAMEELIEFTEGWF